MIHGSRDALVPRDNGLALSRLTSGAVYYELKGAGHMFFLGATWDEIGAVLHKHIKQV